MGRGALPRLIQPIQVDSSPCRQIRHPALRRARFCSPFLPHSIAARFCNPREIACSSTGRGSVRRTKCLKTLKILLYDTMQQSALVNQATLIRKRATACSLHRFCKAERNVVAADVATALTTTRMCRWRSAQKESRHRHCCGAIGLTSKAAVTVSTCYCGLAARALCRERGSRRGLLLLTTFDGGSRQVAHQEVQIELICRQAESLQLPVLGCPLFPHVRYEQRVEQALQLAAKSSPLPLRRICSGDLHLEHILQWRAEHIGPLAAAVGASLHAPLWNVPYKTLLHDLAASGVPCRVCATNGAVALGTRFDAALVAQLPAGTDAFGENGEFHTLAEVIGAPCMRVPPQHALFFELTVVIVHPGLGCAGWCGPFACIERAVGAAGPPRALMN